MYLLPDSEWAKFAAKFKSKKQVDKADGSGKTTVYEYSDKQVQHRNREKAKRVEGLRKNIDKLRTQVQKDLTSKDEKTRLTALAIALIDETFERVGNPQSAKEGHYGVTGWMAKHVTFSGGKATLKYVGKSGVKQEKTVSNAKVVKALKDATKAGGETICEGDDCTVGSSDVNAYLKPFDVTAKDLRGFHANTEMQTRLKAVRSKGGKLPTDKKEREKQLKDEFKTALEETAEAVGHEASTLKSQYLVPGLEDAYLKDGKVSDKLDKKSIWESFSVDDILEVDSSPKIQVQRTGRRIVVSLVAQFQYHDGFATVGTYGAVGQVASERLSSLEAAAPCRDEVEAVQAEVPLKGLYMVTSAAIAPALRGKGWGRKMYEAVLKEAAKEGCAVVPEHCWHPSMTSGDAKRVWDSLRRDHFSVGDVVWGGARRGRKGSIELATDDEWLRFATKSRAEKEDEATEKLVRKAPKKKPPRHDLRKERVDSEEDPDFKDKADASHDKDLSKNYKRIGMDRRGGLRVAADDKDEPHKPGEVWKSEQGHWVGSAPKLDAKGNMITNTWMKSDPDAKEKATAFSKGKSLEEIEGDDKAKDEDEAKGDKAKDEKGDKGDKAPELLPKEVEKDLVKQLGPSGKREDFKILLDAHKSWIKRQKDAEPIEDTRGLMESLEKMTGSEGFADSMTKLIEDRAEDKPKKKAPKKKPKDEAPQEEPEKAPEKPDEPPEKPEVVKERVEKLPEMLKEVGVEPEIVGQVEKAISETAPDVPVEDLTYEQTQQMLREMEQALVDLGIQDSLEEQIEKARLEAEEAARDPELEKALADLGIEELSEDPETALEQLGLDQSLEAQIEQAAKSFDSQRSEIADTFKEGLSPLRNYDPKSSGDDPLDLLDKQFETMSVSDQDALMDAFEGEKLALESFSREDFTEKELAEAADAMENPFGEAGLGPADRGKALARSLHAKNVVANPRWAGGSEIKRGYKATPEELDERSEVAFNQYIQAPEAIRIEAAKQLAAELEQLPRDAPEREELERVADAMALAATIMDDRWPLEVSTVVPKRGPDGNVLKDEDGNVITEEVEGYLRPEPTDEFKALAKMAHENGNADLLLKGSGRKGGIEHRRATQEVMEDIFLDPDTGLDNLDTFFEEGKDEWGEGWGKTVQWIKDIREAADGDPNDPETKKARKQLATAQWAQEVLVKWGVTSMTTGQALADTPFRRTDEQRKEMQKKLRESLVKNQDQDKAIRDFAEQLAKAETPEEREALAREGEMAVLRTTLEAVKEAGGDLDLSNPVVRQVMDTLESGDLSRLDVPYVRQGEDPDSRASDGPLSPDDYREGAVWQTPNGFWSAKNKAGDIETWPSDDPEAQDKAREFAKTSCLTERKPGIRLIPWDAALLTN